MKLLCCLDCADIFSLSSKEKSCGCGKTSGKYIDDLNAVYSGNAQPIGFSNKSFRLALQLQRIEDASQYVVRGFHLRLSLFHQWQQV